MEVPEAQDREGDVPGFQLPAWLQWGPLRASWGGAEGGEHIEWSRRTPRRGGNACQAQTDAPDSILVTRGVGGARHLAP